jgi:hypothetical protein
LGNKSSSDELKKKLEKLARYGEKKFVCVFEIFTKDLSRLMNWSQKVKQTKNYDDVI